MKQKKNLRGGVPSTPPLGAYVSRFSLGIGGLSDDKIRPNVLPSVCPIGLRPLAQQPCILWLWLLWNTNRKHHAERLFIVGENAGQVLDRVRVRREALDHLSSEHVDELWRAAEDLLERSAVDDARRRQARRRRDVDYRHRLVALLDELDSITVRPYIVSYSRYIDGDDENTWPYIRLWPDHFFDLPRIRTQNDV